MIKILNRTSLNSKQLSSEARFGDEVGITIHKGAARQY